MNKQQIKNQKQMQKKMVDGAVYESPSGFNQYIFNGKQFVDKNGNGIRNNEWNNMILKTPAPAPKYSTEFEKMGAIKMMELMIKGLILEMDNHSLVKLDVENGNNPYQIEIGGSWLSFGGWEGACRVFQAPKMEKRWQWLYKNLEGIYEATSQHYATDEEARNSLRSTRPEKVIKIEESKDEFEVESN